MEIKNTHFRCDEIKDTFMRTYVI